MNELKGYDDCWELLEKDLMEERQKTMYNPITDGTLKDAEEYIKATTPVVTNSQVVSISPEADARIMAGMFEKINGSKEYPHSEKLGQPTNPGERPWGSFKVLHESPSYKVKEITVDPGHRLSLQLHLHRSEHWIVISGTATVTKGEETFYLPEGQSAFIPACTKHRLANEGKLPLVLVEIQDGLYTGEDDITRFEDDYARV